jgi:hypothetical protein
MDDAPRAAVPADAAVPAVDAQEIAVVDPCKMTPDPSNPTCNPPAPPKSIDAKIIAANVKGKDLVITVSKGRDDGIAMGWKAELVAGSGRVVAPVDVLKVDKRSTDLRLTGAASLPLPDLHVRFNRP